jgi:hypothetical protein
MLHPGEALNEIISLDRLSRVRHMRSLPALTIHDIHCLAWLKSFITADDDAVTG